MNKKVHDHYNLHQHDFKCPRCLDYLDLIGADEHDDGEGQYVQLHFECMSCAFLSISIQVPSLEAVGISSALQDPSTPLRADRTVYSTYQELDSRDPHETWIRYSDRIEFQADPTELFQNMVENCLQTQNAHDLARLLARAAPNAVYQTSSERDADSPVEARYEQDIALNGAEYHVTTYVTRISMESPYE